MMLLRDLRIIAAFGCLVASVAAAASVSRPQTTAPAESTVVCRVLETHAAGTPSAAAVIFHQRDKQDQQRLGGLLTQHSGAAVRIQVGPDGLSQSATVFRIKSCFGRGLLLMPAGAAPRDGETFTITFPPRGPSSQ
jgi:hypothetical protein